LESISPSQIVTAARDQRNNILQPEDLDGVGVYNIRGAMPSPYINILCAHATKDELSPFVYETAMNAMLNVTGDLPTAWTHKFDFTNFASMPRTQLHEIFDWGTDDKTLPPVFYKFPLAFNVCSLAYPI